ncbi:MAG: AI-2E family transporter [Patescibacteria group bacterium]
MTQNNNQQKYIQSFAFLAILAGTLVLAYFIFQPYLAIIILAGVLVIFFQPLYKKFLKFFNGRGSLAAFVVAVIALLALAIPLGLFVVVISNELVSTYKFFSAYNLSGFIQSLQNWFGGVFGFDMQIAAIDFDEYMRSIFEFLVKNILSFFSNVVDFIVKIVIFIMTLFYLFRDGSKIKKYIVQLSPMSDHYDEAIFDHLILSVKSIIGGKIVVSLVQGILAIIGFTIFGVPNPAMWGSMVAIVALIPMIGTSIIAIPTIIYLALSGQVGAAIGLTVWSAVVVGLVDNILGPKLISRDIKVNPLLILLSVFGGLALFGPLGFLFGPLILSLLFALLEIYQKEFRNYISGNH